MFAGIRGVILVGVRGQKRARREPVNMGKHNLKQTNISKNTSYTSPHSLQ